MRVSKKNGLGGSVFAYFDQNRWSAHDVFQFLRPDQIKVLSEASSTFSCSTGDTVYRQRVKVGHVYVVLSGKVSLETYGFDGNVVRIAQVGPGEMFGSCLSADLDTYSLTAKCTEDSQILKINAEVLKRVMDDDPRVGYAIQSRISAIYYKRYIATMRKLRDLVQWLPPERTREKIRPLNI